MLPLPKPRRPTQLPDAKKLYAESEALKLPPPPVGPKPVDQKEITYALAKRHRKTGYPRVVAPVGVAHVPRYFCDRAKDIAEKLKSHKRRYGKTKHYYDSCEFYDNNDPDTFRLQGIYYGFYNEYRQTLAKAEACLKLNPKDYKAMLLKADTLFRMCDFENALLIYSNGINFKFPYKNWFLDGYYRTTALLYNIAGGNSPMFYGGNMRVFYRLVSDQERTLKIFNDTYKCYDEVYPLEHNLSAVKEDINMLHVSKAAPLDQVDRRVKKSAIQQLYCAKKILGGFWDHKLEVEWYLIKKQYCLPRFGRKNKTEKIEKALKYLKGRVDQFEVVCAFVKNHSLRQNDQPKDWPIEYRRWMTQLKLKSSVPSAKIGRMENTRYRWAFSPTLFHLRSKPTDVYWIRRFGKSNLYKKHGHIFAPRHPWWYFIAQKSARHGVLAALRNKGDEWCFMKKLQRNVWTSLVEQAPLKEEVTVPDHIRDLSKRLEDYLAGNNSTLLTIPEKEPPKYINRLYYDPETDMEQYEENRHMLQQTICKLNVPPSIIPETPDKRPIPARLMEVVETRVHDDAIAWEKRRKMSIDMREGLARAEAVKATHVAENSVLFSSNVKKEAIKLKKAHPNSEMSKSGENVSIKTSTADEKKQNLDEEERTPVVSPPKDRMMRKSGKRFKCDILKKNSDIDRLLISRIRRRLDRNVEVDQVIQTPDVKEKVKTAGGLEKERMLAASNDNSFELAKRKFDNQKAVLLEKAYAVLMNCTRVSEFLELELEIDDLLDETFPPKTMRFPNGDPICLKGYPLPAVVYTQLLPETLGANIKKKRKKQAVNDTGKIKAESEAEIAQETAAVNALIEKRGMRNSLKAVANATVSLDSNISGNTVNQGSPRAVDENACYVAYEPSSSPIIESPPQLIPELFPVQEPKPILQREPIKEPELASVSEPESIEEPEPPMPHKPGPPSHPKPEPHLALKPEVKPESLPTQQP